MLAIERKIIVRNYIMTFPDDGQDICQSNHATTTI